LVNLACVVGLLLGLASLVMWPVSYVLAAEARQESGGELLLLRINSGRLKVYRHTAAGSPPTQSQSPYRTLRWQQSRDGGDWVRFTWRDRAVIGELTPTDPPRIDSVDVDLRFPVGVFALLLVVPFAVWRRAMLRRLRHHHRRQSGLCLHCGYNLQGVTADACPGCGHERPMVTVEDA